MNPTIPFSNESVLLTGASGSLGSYLLQQWKDNLNVYFTGRKQVDHPRYFSGDLCDEIFLKDLLQHTNCRFLIHNAALTNIWGPWKDFKESNLRMMEAVIKAAIHFPDVKIVFISTPSVYHYSGRQMVQESFKPNK